MYGAAVQFPIVHGKKYKQLNVLLYVLFFLGRVILLLLYFSELTSTNRSIKFFVHMIGGFC